MLTDLHIGALMCHQSKAFTCSKEAARADYDLAFKPLCPGWHGDGRIHFEPLTFDLEAMTKEERLCYLAS